MANEYDKILRDNFREPKAALLRQLVSDNITGIRPLVPKLQHTLEREPDTVAEITTEEGRQFIVHMEWQSTNDLAMAARMALYDLLLAQTYKLDVPGAVLYLGNDPLRMKDTYSFFDFRYRCKMIDVRRLDPETFLLSDNAGEVLFAILTGSSDIAQKKAIVRRIFAKLQELYKSDAAMLRVKIKQLELLSLLRGKTIQQIIVEEENNMPVTIDITQDLRYQQGIEVGRREKEKEKLEMAENMFKDGLNLFIVQKYTGLPTEILKDIAAKTSNQ